MSDIKKFISSLNGNETTSQILEKALAENLIDATKKQELEASVETWKFEDSAFKNAALSMTSYTAHDKWMAYVNEKKAQGIPVSHQELLAGQSDFFKEQSLFDRVIAATVTDKFTPAQVMENGDFENSENRNGKKVFFSFQDGVFRSLHNFCSATVMISQNESGENVLHLTYRGTDSASQNHMVSKENKEKGIEDKPAGKFASAVRMISYMMGIYPDMDRHSDNFAVLERSVLEYAKNPANGIAKIEVSGHSLGGAMAERFIKSDMLLNSDLQDKVSTMTYGAPSTKSNLLGAALLNTKRAGEVVVQEWAQVYHEVEAKYLAKANKGLPPEEKSTQLSLVKDLLITPEFAAKAMVRTAMSVPKYAKLLVKSIGNVLEETSLRLVDAKDSVFDEQKRGFFGSVKELFKRVVTNNHSLGKLEREQVQFRDAWDVVPMATIPVTGSASVIKYVKATTDKDPKLTALLATPDSYNKEIKNASNDDVSRKKFTDAHSMTRYTLNSLLNASPMRESDGVTFKRLNEPTLEDFLEIKSKKTIVDCEAVMHKFRVESKVEHDAFLKRNCKNIAKIIDRPENSNFFKPEKDNAITLTDGVSGMKKGITIRNIERSFGIKVTGTPEQIESVVNMNVPTKETFAAYRGYMGTIEDIQRVQLSNKVAQYLDKAFEEIKNSSKFEEQLKGPRVVMSRDESYYKEVERKAAQKIVSAEQNLGENSNGYNFAFTGMFLGNNKTNEEYKTTALNEPKVQILESATGQAIGQEFNPTQLNMVLAIDRGIFRDEGYNVVMESKKHKKPS